MSSYNCLLRLIKFFWTLGTLFKTKFGRDLVMIEIYLGKRLAHNLQHKIDKITQQKIDRSLRAGHKIDKLNFSQNH